MKVVYIHHEYKNRRKRYGNEMAALGHDVKFLTVRNKKKPGQVTQKKIAEYGPDLVWLLSPFYIQNNVITPEAVDWIKSKKIPLVFYGTLNTQIPYTEQNHIWKKFDFCFVHNIDHCNYLKSIGLNAHYAPIGFYPDQYMPTKSHKSYDISFAGNTQTTVETKKDKRVIYLKALASFGIKIFGKRFSSRGVSASGYSTHSQQRDIYASSKINLDLPFINSSLSCYKDKYHIKNRFFEVPATCRFLLSVRCPELLNIFDESMVGYFDDDIKSMKETVSKYLKDKSTRKVMAKRAYKEAINKHTFHHRFKMMFKIIEG